jgi:hypothetical protein
MKRILVVVVVLIGNLYALSPFSLENIKEVNLKVIDKSQLTTKENLEKIKYDLKYNLEKLGIKTKSDNFSNFLVKIEGIKIKENYVMHISMFIVEDSIPLRNQDSVNMSITYYKDDLFDSNPKDIQIDIYESIINYLLSELKDQHIQENS